MWARGVDRDQFNPERRDMAWRRSIGIGDDEMVIAFLGRIVMEKGLDVFADAIHAFAEREIKHRVLVIGEGPARPWFEQQLPDAIFTGQLTGDDLARALASADLFLNPSITEAFGNVTLEAMACGAAGHRGASRPERPISSATRSPARWSTGRTRDEFADALEAYARDPDLRRRHGEAGLAIARTMDWDSINATVIRAYKHAIHKRERLTRMTRQSPRRPEASTCARHFTRSIRCAASSRIAAISCSSSSSMPSRPTRWLSAVIRFLTARPIAGPAISECARLELRQTFDQRVDLVGPLFEMAAAFVGDLERLARAFDRGLLDQSHVLEQRQRRIDHARTRRIFAAGQLLDRADEVVAVARLVGDQLQQHEPELAAFEHPPRATAAATTAAPRPRRRSRSGTVPSSPASRARRASPSILPGD